jgi:hypothetical protein
MVNFATLKKRKKERRKVAKRVQLKFLPGDNSKAALLCRKWRKEKEKKEERTLGKRRRRKSWKKKLQKWRKMLSLLSLSPTLSLSLSSSFSLSLSHPLRQLEGERPAAALRVSPKRVDVHFCPRGFFGLFDSIFVAGMSKTVEIQHV